METNDSTRPIAKSKCGCCGRLRRGFKYLVLALLVLGAIYVVWTNHRGTQARQRIADQLQQRSLPASLDEWRKHAQDKIPDAENGARFYKAAFELQPYFGLYDDISLEPCEQVHPESLTRIKAALDENDELFRLISKAREQKQFGYELQFNNSTIDRKSVV